VFKVTAIIICVVHVCGADKCTKYHWYIENTTCKKINEAATNQLQLLPTTNEQKPRNSRSVNVS